MFTDWLYWLSGLTPDQLLTVIGGLLLVDAPRYAFTKIAMCLWDATGDFVRWFRGESEVAEFSYCPSVCVVLAGYNEEATLEATLNSVWGTYPRLEIIVVDDGSEDDMGAVARRYARTHAGVTVLAKGERGGKSSCINFALGYTRAEVIVIVDTDSHLDPTALWEIVQPLADAQVAAVSATILARNPFDNLVTWLQSYEYLHSIFVGRMFSARVGILGIASGAFAAYRRTAIDRVAGWDVGPGEDGDMTLRMRKAGYNVAFAPYAQCYTNLPTTWWGLFKQRRRWNRGVIRYKCRKHVDMAAFWRPGFRFSNLCLLLNIWIFNILFLYGFWAYFLWFCFHADEQAINVLITTYFCYVSFHLVQAISVLYYSINRRRDALICSVLPVVPFYQLFRKVVRLVSVTEELFLRASFQDNYVPSRVREATWHW